MKVGITHAANYKIGDTELSVITEHKQIGSCGLQVQSGPGSDYKNI